MLRYLRMLLCSLPLSVAVFAFEPALLSETLQVRYDRLSQEFRCLVCQNQTLAESDNPLALALKKELILRLNRGETDEAIAAAWVQRYGDFVRFTPPRDRRTWLLWYGPLAGLLVLAAVLMRFKKQKA